MRHVLLLDSSDNTRKTCFSVQVDNADHSALRDNEATLQRLPPYAQINYIAAAVRNTAINTIKRDQKETARCIPLDDLTEDFPQAHIPGAEVRYLEKEKQEELLTAFQEIREEERQLLYGKYLMDLSDTRFLYIPNIETAQ